MPTHATPEHDLQQQQEAVKHDVFKSKTEEKTSSVAQILGVKGKANSEKSPPQKKENIEYNQKDQQTTAQDEILNNDEKLSMTKRLSTFTTLVGHLSDAYATFIDVANQLYAETKAKKATDAALTASLINIAMVWITPGVSSALEGLANILEKSTKHAAFVAAYHLLGQKDKIAASLVGIPKDQIIRNVGTIEPSKDIHKDFIEGAKRGFVLTTSQLRKKINGLIHNRKLLSDGQLLAITAKWDPEILSAKVLKARLKQQMDIWEKNVAPIGETESIGGSNVLEANKTTGRRAKGLVWVLQEQGSAYLCMVEASIQRDYENPSYRFLRFIPESMKEMAIQKAEAQPHQAAGISYRRPNEIQGYPTAKPPKNAAKQ